MRMLKTIKQWLKARKANPFEEAQEYLLKPNGGGSGVEDYICFAIRIAYDQGKISCSAAHAAYKMVDIVIQGHISAASYLHKITGGRCTCVEVQEFRWKLVEYLAAEWRKGVRL